MAEENAPVGTAKKVNRYDSINPETWMTNPFTRNKEGFLVGRAIVTSVGVFTYKREDGKTQRELRLPEEVFASDSLESMKLKPITNDHPKDKVTSQNVEKLSVGSLGSKPSSTNQERTWDGYTDRDKLTDGFHVAIDLTITHEDAIEDVINGKRALSMGYDCEIEVVPEASVWCGMPYDVIQRNIRYNHCAIVPKGRAGDNARIRLDSEDAVLENTISNSKPKEGCKMRKIRIDGVDYEGDDLLILKLTELQKRADDAESALKTVKEAEATLKKAEADLKEQISKTEADKDSNKDRADKAEAELKKLQETAIDEKRVDGLVAEKMALLVAAKTSGVELKEDMSNMDIRKAVIMKVFPQAKLDGKDDVYISARYDAALESLETEKQTNADGASRIISSVNHKGDGVRNSDTAQKEMVERMQNLSSGVQSKKEG